MKILDFGSLNYDYVYSVDHVSTPGETISSGKMETFCGGKGLNQAIAVARAGGEVYLAGLIGTDGQQLIDICKENTVNVSCVRRVEGKSGHAIIQVDKNGQNSILLYGGSNQKITKGYVDDVLSKFTNGDYILLQNEINYLDYIMDAAYEKGMQIILNPSPYNEKIRACDMYKVSVFLINEIEGEQITGKSDWNEILDELACRYPQAKVILTLGEQGAIYCYKNQRYKQEIYPVKTIDTTAAGDTFTGYFIAAMMKGMSIEQALEQCAKASAIAVSRKGATNSIPTLDEVIQFLRK